MKKWSDKELKETMDRVSSQFTEVLKKAEQEATEKMAKSETKTESKEEDVFSPDEIESVKEIYADMTKSEAEAHYEAIKKALNIEEVSVEEMAKSEVSEEMTLMKSENESLKAQIEELKKSQEAYSQAIKAIKSKFFSVPEQKSVTSLEFIAKSEDEKKDVKDVSSMSTAQINEALKNKAAKLEKKDRELVYDYFAKKVDINGIKHLL